ncbi:MAG: DUF1153 domain-containing protein [Gammaproteobacteria bacterium]
MGQELHWTPATTNHRPKSKIALVLEFTQGKTTVAAVSQAYDLPLSEVWVEDGKKGIENALRANPQYVREQYERNRSNNDTLAAGDGVK